ncbi:MAG: dipeptidase [Anaerolineae bacterium]
MTDTLTREAALSLHANALVVDGHCDTLGRVVDEKMALGERQTTGHLDLPRLREGGVNAQVFACFTGGARGRNTWDRFLRMTDALHQALRAYPEQLLLAERAADVVRAHADGRLAAVLSMEGAEPLGSDLMRLRIAYALGLRNLGFVWGGRNRAGCGVSEPGDDGKGLSAFGKRLVGACNELGILIDVSHLNEPGFWDVLETSRQPVWASHSNARALLDVPRNLWDDQIKALAGAGGLVAVVFTFLRPRDEDGRLEDVLDHIDYIAGLVGPSAVAIGSDFDGIPIPPVGLEDVTRFPALTEGLLARGYGETDVRGILGENWLRLFRQVVG